MPRELCRAARVRPTKGTQFYLGGAFTGALASLKAPELGAIAIKGACARAGITLADRCRERSSRALLEGLETTCFTRSGMLLGQQRRSKASIAGWWDPLSKVIPGCFDAWGYHER